MKSVIRRSAAFSIIFLGLAELHSEVFAGDVDNPCVPILICQKQTNCVESCPAIVNYTPPTLILSNCSANAGTVTCIPPNGSLLSCGTTNIHCNGSVVSGGKTLTASCAFNLTVLGITLASSNPTNACVSYKYVNSNCPDDPPLINETNSITLTATGTPDDGTGTYTWSHPRGGTFSTNGVHAAGTVTYTPPTLASATPSNMSDKVTVMYAYHGVSCTKQAPLNILRPKTLQYNGYRVIIEKTDCTNTNYVAGAVAFWTLYYYDILDQYGHRLDGYKLGFFETFDNFVVGETVTNTFCPSLGIQAGFVDGFPTPNSYSIYTPGDLTITGGTFTDTYQLSLTSSAKQLFWNTTTSTNPSFQATQRYTIQGAAFTLGTTFDCCDGTPPGVGAYLWRNGAQITDGTMIPADN
jgi:hypothetical protein